jgi:hypothetical protein
MQGVISVNTEGKDRKREGEVYAKMCSINVVPEGYERSGGYEWKGWEGW